MIEKDEGGRRKDEASGNSVHHSKVAAPLLLSSFLLHPSLVAVLGATTLLAFSPFNLFFVAFIPLGLLFWLWRRAQAPLQAALLGYIFGLGMFGAGVSWVYISLHDFGGMPMPIAILAVMLFCAYLALFPALTGWLAVKFGGSSTWRFALAVAAAWTLTEWLRGWLLTGFPWLAIGYSQVPWSPLAGLAPIGGVYAMSFATVLIAALASVIPAWSRTWPNASFVIAPALVLLLLASWGLTRVDWTTPSNEPISVSLLQGNIPQELKFDRDRLYQQLHTYLALARENHVKLIVMPESAIPLLKSEVPAEYLNLLKAQVPPGGDMLVGVFDDADEGRQIYNSVMNLGSTPPQVYRKVHLVPFGEFIPLKWLTGWVYTTILSMPLSDQTPGASLQEPLKVAGERVAVNICYEDAFGEEIIRQLPEATLLVNVSNDAWFGERIAPWQHTQIAQTRALETGRYMLRATNTGVTSIINYRGELVASLPQLTTRALHGTVQGRTGATPYVIAGNGPIVGVCLVLLSGLWLGRRYVATPSVDANTEATA
jgi:apolipoprotein N-acyltransferase